MPDRHERKWTFMDRVRVRAEERLHCGMPHAIGEFLLLKANKKRTLTLTAVAVEKLFSARTAENRIASGCPINGFLDFRHISGHQILRHLATFRCEKDFFNTHGCSRQLG
jgi:hypothetical protein